MKYLAIILVAVLAILIVVFISWFLNMKANGKCPLCALKKIFIPTKLTIDISEDEEYSENKVAPTPFEPKPAYFHHQVNLLHLT